MESRKQQKGRFHIEKLEERIAPTTTLTAAPDSAAGSNPPSTAGATATVDINADAANNDGGVTVS